MTTPYDDTARGRSVIRIPAMAGRNAAHAMVETILEKLGDLILRPGLDSEIVLTGERLFLDSDEAARRDLLQIARADAALRMRLLDYLLPVIALRLESGWNDDRLSFVDVTIAAARIQDAVRRLGHFALPPAEKPAVALIVPAWEQHSLATSFAAEEMRRLGAPVRLISGLPGRAIPAALERFPASALMFSVGSGASAARLPELVTHLRRAVPRALPFVVGGPAFTADPAIGRRARADLATNSVSEALNFCDIAPRPAGP